MSSCMSSVESQDPPQYPLGLACEASCEWWEPYLVHLRGIQLVTDHPFPMGSI